MWFTRVSICLMIASCAFTAEIRPKSDFKRSLGQSCDKTYTSTCLKLDIINWMDGLNEKGNFDLLPGVSVVKENGSAATTAEIVAEIGREFPNNPDARLDAFLMKKAQSFLGSHSLKLNFAQADETNVETARKKNKGGGGMGMMLAMGAMMKGTMFALAMGALAAIAGKALMTGLISLVLSTVIGLKSLTSGGGHTEVHHASISDHHRRSIEEPLPLGMRPDYKPA